MGFFSELFKSKPADSKKARETSVNAGAELQSGGSIPSLTPEGTKRGPSFGPVSAESRKKTSRLSLSLPDGEIKLVLADVIHRIPSHFLKPGAHDLQRPLHFSIQDLFSDIARGRASVPLSEIAKLCPEVFREKIDLVEDIEVHLPLQKLVAQVTAFPIAAKQTPTGKAPEKKSAFNVAVAPAEPRKTSTVKLPEFTGESISLRLAAILPTVPKEAMIGEMEGIDESVQITVAYRLIGPQLAGGKVGLLPNDFIDALPVEYRIHFARGATVNIPIPLEEILAAQARTDVSKTAEIKTEKPSADLEKLSPLPVDSSAPAASPFGRPLTMPPPRILAQPQAGHPSHDILISEPVASPASFASLQTIFQTNEPLDPQTIAQLVCRFPGITACVIVSKNNLIKAGEVPSDFDTEAFRRTALEHPQSLEGETNKPKTGPEQNPVLNSERFMASCFTQPEASLCVFQNDRELAPEVRDKLNSIIVELARVL